MAIEFVSYDDTLLEPGKFYTIRINKDMATAVIEAPPSPLYFTNKTYITTKWNGISSIEIWKTEMYDNAEVITNITSKVDWFIIKSNNTIIVRSNYPISGFIKFL